jgi:hypothetical protein
MSSRTLAWNILSLAMLLQAGCGSGSSGSPASSPPTSPGQTPDSKEPQEPGPTARVQRWSVVEVSLRAAEKYSNPFTQVEVTATLRGPRGIVKTVPGFWAGKNEFRVRMTPTEEGDWSYEVRSDPADSGLEARGGFRATRAAASEHGFVRRDPANPRGFIHDDGTRVFIWGQTYYEILKNARAGSNWKRAIEGTRAYRMNKVRLLVNPSWDKHTAIYPKSSPFAAGNRDNLALTHWDVLDDVVEHLARSGMIADLILFLDHEDGFGTRAQDLRYVRYVIARYAAYPNVVWCLTNEWHFTGKSKGYWNEIGALVSREDPWMRKGDAIRLLSIHHKTGFNFDFGQEAWPSHAVVQVGVRNAKFDDGDRWGNESILLNTRFGMPVINDEYGYLNEKDFSLTSRPKLSRTKHRNIIWGIAAAGGYGSAGDLGVYSDGASPIFSSNWHDDPAYGDISRLVAFWTTRKIEYWRMSSRNDLVASGSRVYVLARPGKEYVVYSAAGGPFELELAAGRYDATRFDPRTGATAPFPDVSGGGPRTFSLPEDNDWVVHLKKIGN